MCKCYPELSVQAGRKSCRFVLCGITEKKDEGDEDDDGAQPKPLTLIRRSGKGARGCLLHGQGDLGCPSRRQRFPRCCLLPWHRWTVTRPGCGGLSPLSLLAGVGPLEEKTLFVSTADNSGRETWQRSQRSYPWVPGQPSALWLVKSHGSVTQRMMILKVSECFFLRMLF